MTETGKILLKEMELHTPTRMVKVLSILADKGGSLRQAMLEAGYSAEYADNPQKLRRTTKWEELLAEIPDAKLIRKINQLLDAKKIKKVFKQGLMTEIEESEDTFAIAKGLDIALKLKSKYPLEKAQTEANNSFTDLVRKYYPTSNGDETQST